MAPTTATRAARNRRETHHDRIGKCEPGSWQRRLKVLDYVRALLAAGASEDALMAYLDDVNDGLR